MQRAVARPQFDGVTGVSTGALIAPFAFLGDEESIDAIVRLYRNPKKDWVKQRGRSTSSQQMSFAEVPGLEREMREGVTGVVRRIADAAGPGGSYVNTTDVDDGACGCGTSSEAQRAVENNDLERVHASCSPPRYPRRIPFREIDGELYVDGGVTGNIIYGGRVAEEEASRPLGQSIRLPCPRSVTGSSSTTSSARSRR